MHLCVYGVYSPLLKHRLLSGFTEVSFSTLYLYLSMLYVAVQYCTVLAPFQRHLQMRSRNTQLVYLFQLSVSHDP